MRFSRMILGLVLSVAAVAFLAPSAEAGCGLFGGLFGRKSCGSRAQVSSMSYQATYSATYGIPACQSGSCAAPSYAVPAAPNCQNGSCAVPYNAPAPAKIGPVSQEPPATMNPAPERGQVVQASLRIAGPVEPVPQPLVPASPNQGFIEWLNAYRATVGAGPVVEDPNLSAWAALAARNGYRHTLVVGRNQNVGKGSLDMVSRLWVADRPHGDPMRDPSITRVGLGSWGDTWVLNLN